MPADHITVSVVYALADRQTLVKVEVPAASSVADAIAASKLIDAFPELRESSLACAIYGRVVALDQQVAAGDRIEILRPLLIDPKEHRRQIAAKSRAKAR